MSRDNVEIVRSIYEATNRRDWDAVFCDQHPDTEQVLPSPYGPYRGREEIQGHWEERMAAFDAVVVEPEVPSTGSLRVQ
jgi:ketosteroid isomerase-like protein